MKCNNKLGNVKLNGSITIRLVSEKKRKAGYCSNKWAFLNSKRANKVCSPRMLTNIPRMLVNILAHFDNKAATFVFFCYQV